MTTTKRLVALTALLLPGIMTEPLHSASAPVAGNDRLPDGSTFLSWELPPNWTRTYHVDQRNPEASDQNPGTAERPWKTIQKAADTLQPGERVLIHAGTYREWVKPRRGGTGPDAMIGYQAAPGEEVILKGSDLWKPAWSQTANQARPDGAPVTWRAELPEPAKNDSAFSMLNFVKKEEWRNDLPHVFSGENDAGYNLRCGQLFLDGKPLTQVLSYEELLKIDNAFWVEGKEAVHVRLSGEASPVDKTFEITVRPQVFSPEVKFLDFIRLSGVKVLHAANGVPIPYPQRGAVSAMLGHHWIIEDCEVGHANTIGVDIGGQMWSLNEGRMLGWQIVRRCHVHHCGVNGLAAWHAGANQNLLIEDNLFEHCGGLPLHGHLETSAVKIHRVTSCLIRRNVFLHSKNGSGLWVDGESTNTRVTQNLFHDTMGGGFGAIFIEINRGPNMIDNNIILNTDIHGIYSTDAARIIVMQNLIANSARGAAVQILRAGKWRFGNRIPWEDESWVQANIFANVDRYVQMPNLTSSSDFNVLGGQVAGAGKPFALFSEYTTEKNGEYDRAGWTALGRDANSVETAMSVTFDDKTMELKISAPPGFAMKPAAIGVWERLPSMSFVYEMIQADFLGKPRTQPVPRDDAKEIIGLPLPNAIEMGPLSGIKLDGTPVKVDPRRLPQP